LHIPDGYLSPETCGVFGAGMIPVFAAAGRRVRRVVKTRYVPLLAIGAAYSFLVMMLNVPIPDGTTAHAVGAVLIGVVLGPEAAIIAVGTALAIQALFFGDGGVLTYGANAFNMAFVSTVVGYVGVYRPLTRRLSLTSPRRAFAAGLASYVGLCAAALCTAVELGVQPDLFRTASGAPLYAPYHLTQTIPAMLLAHVTVAGGVEFALTVGVILYLQRANLPILRINHPTVPDGEFDAMALPERAAPRIRWWYALAPIAALALVTPLGLAYNSGAFGEDNVHAHGARFLQRNHLAAIPAGLNRYAGFWHHALFNGYDFSHDRHPAVGYVVSAFAGASLIALVLLALFGVARLVEKHRARRRLPAGTPAVSPALAVPNAPRAASAGRGRPTPGWLLTSEVGLCPCACIGKRAKGSFVQKTLSGAATAMRQAMFGDQIATGPGLLQRIDARVKLLTVLGLLVGAALLRNLPVLLGLYGLTLALAVVSNLKLSFFFKRVWLFIPLFSGVVVLPATLNLVTRGHIVIPLGHWWFGHRVGITSQGLHAAALLVSRVAVSISLVVLLTLTTPWARLMTALRALYVPRMFIQVMGMAYRYIFHLLGSVDDMYTARRSRMVGAETDVTAGRSFVAAAAGALIGKAHGLSEEVYLAMVSRGYTGEAVTLDTFRLRALEAVWAGACILTLAAALGIDRALGR
jgi:cobalt ECF transporter T component CbiQ/cobalamin biosynthesis protein CbiM